MISFESRGSFVKMEKFLRKMKTTDFRRIIEREAEKGVRALAEATPEDSGIAADSWGYEISQNGRSITISWTNSNLEDGFPVAVMIQYGYGTGTGGYVQGRDYINPAMKPVFDEIADAIWKAVKSA